MSEILWTEFEEGQPVEVLRVGTFTDRRGMEVVITPEDLDAFVANFEAGTAGQDVPVDVDHKRAEAGGWVKRIWRDGEKLLASVDWNEMGQKLVGERVYRYLSGTVDLAGKVIKSVSLVNFPAVKGLKPVELSEGVYALEVSPGLLDRIIAAVKAAFVTEEPTPQADAGEAPVEELEQVSITEQEAQTMPEDREQVTAEMREQIKAELMAEMEAEFAEKEKQVAELKQQIRTEVEAEMAERYAKRQALTEFAEELCNADHGLSAKPEDVVAFLSELDGEQLEAGKTLLKAKIIDFEEHGSAAKGKREAQQQLPAEYAALLKSTELNLEEWWAAAAQDDLGDMAGYDLTSFKEA